MVETAIDITLKEARIVYLNVFVSDLAASRAFYRDALGLRIIEEDADAIHVDGGQVVLVLRRAQDYGVDVPTRRDGSADIVFLVDDVRTMRAALEQRGVDTFLPTSWYGPGGLADFYDPDNHWCTLYQPSAEAMTWLSASRIRAVMRARQERGAPAVIPAKPKGANGEDLSGVRLDGSEIIYLFKFIEDPDETEAFYHNLLGLQALEGGPCSQTCSGDVNGVVKYDTGGIMLATHFIEEERPQEKVDEHACPPRELDLERMQSVAATFHVEDIGQVMAGLSQRGVRFKPEVVRSKRGTTVAFEDPSGHLYFLYEPSEEAFHRPSGTKVAHILRTPL